MVGLTCLEHQLETTERLTKKKPDYEIIRNAYLNFIENLEQMQPVLKAELQLLTK